MPLQFTENRANAGRMNFTANPRSRMASVINIGWDNVTGKPDLVEVGDGVDAINVSATSRVLGRISSGAGDAEELTGANVKTILGFPTSTTDNTVPRFDSTAGNIQTSGLSIDDSNNLTVPASVKFSFDPTASQALDASAATKTMANSTTISLGAISGVAVINETIIDGGVGLILFGGNAVSILAQTTTVYVVSASPTSGKIGIFYDSGAYKITNNQGNPISLNILFLKTRNFT